MSADLFSLLAGAGVSLAASYIPGFAPAWARLDSVQKRALMGILLLGVTAVAYLGVGAGWWAGVKDWQSYVVWLFQALMANQATYKLTKG